MIHKKHTPRCAELLMVIAFLWGAVFAVAGPSTEVYLDNGGDRLTIGAGGTLRLIDGATLNSLVGVGDLGISSTGLTVAETGDGVTHRTTFTISSGFELLVTDAAANGAHASLKLYDFPAGYIKFVGSTLDVDVTCETDGLGASATYDFGVGTATTGVDNAALATTEQNVINTIGGDLSSSAAALGAALATDVAVDGTSTAADLYFNAAFEADDASADDVCTISGTVTVTWINLGDYYG